MPIPLTQYIKIKDKYCITYSGSCNEYVLLLKYLRPSMNKEFETVDIWLHCQEDSYEYLKDEKQTTKHLNEKEFAFVRKIKGNLKEHPVQKLIKESSIKILPLKNTPDENNKTFYISKHGILPTRSLNETEIKKIKQFASDNGYKEIQNYKNAGWIIGVENEEIIKGYINNSKISLIPTGVGTDLYKELFYNLEIFPIAKNI